jgi:hypothetical protein
MGFSDRKPREGALFAQIRSKEATHLPQMGEARSNDS